jgi:hypothetical protein
MSPSARATIGVFAILALIAAEAVLIMACANLVAAWPILVQTLFYVAAGLVWLVPARWLLLWIYSSGNQ